MFKKLCLLAVCGNLIIAAAQAQKSRTISGVIMEKNTKKALPYATITLLKTTSGATSDLSGKFRLQIPAKTANPKLLVFYVGYEQDTINISPNKNYYKIYLTEFSHSLNKVIIKGVSEKVAAKRAPAPIVLITPKQIQQTSSGNVIDALAKHTPGLSTLKTGPNVSKPFIHGLGFNRVLSLFDGIRMSGQQWGEEHGIEVDNYNIKNAKVIEGPSSLEYGSDALAGVMSLIPYSPGDTDKKLHGRWLSEYQNNNGLFGNSLRLTYGNKNWSYAMVGSYRIARNFQNTIDGRVYNTGFQQENFTASIKRRFKKGYSKLTFNFYDNLQGIPDGSRDSLTRKFTKQIFEADSDNVASRPVVSKSELNSYNLSPLHQHIQNFRLYNKNHFELNKAEINFYWALQHNNHLEFSHPTQPQQAGLDLSLNTLDYGVSYDFPSFSNIHLSTGISGLYQTNKNQDATDFPIPNYHLFTIGGYLYGKWNWQQWTIDAGARYDIHHIKNEDNFYVGTDPKTGFDEQVFIPDTAGSNLQYPVFNYDFEGVTMSFGTAYELNEHVNLKANIARGYRAPNISELASNGLDVGSHIRFQGNTHFKPEFSLQESAGLNILYNGVSGFAGVFNNNISNFIYSAQLSDDNGNPIVDNQGNKLFGFQQSKAQIYGFDAALSIHPMKMHGFSFDNSVALTYGFNRNSIYSGKGVDGEYLPQIPPFKWVSDLSQEIHLKSHHIHSVTIDVGAEYDAAQNHYLALNGTENYTPSYLLFNAALNFKIRYHKQKTFNLKVGVNNLLNTAYQSNMSRLKYFEFYSAAPKGHLGIYNMGRNFTAKLIVPF